MGHDNFFNCFSNLFNFTKSMTPPSPEQRASNFFSRVKLQGTVLGRDAIFKELTALFTKADERDKYRSLYEDREKMWHESERRCDYNKAKLNLIIKESGALSAWLDFTLAQSELEQESIPDSAIVLSFMGSGASTKVNFGQIKYLLSAIQQANKEQG